MEIPELDCLRWRWRFALPVGTDSQGGSYGGAGRPADEAEVEWRDSEPNLRTQGALCIFLDRD